MLFFEDLSLIAKRAAEASELRLQRLSCEWIECEIKAAQHRLHLTAFGVGMLAFLAGFGICWLAFVS